MPVVSEEMNTVECEKNHSFYSNTIGNTNDSTLKINQVESSAKLVLSATRPKSKKQLESQNANIHDNVKRIRMYIWYAGKMSKGKILKGKNVEKHILK